MDFKKFQRGLFLLVVFAFRALAAEPEVDPKDFQSFPPVEPRDAIATFQIREGFRVELAASEPNIASPVALSFDEDGRMYVVEMRDYSEHRDESLGRIRRLEDTDGDGFYDKSVVFADKLPWPTAIICYNGGVFVGATPDILFLRDNDGDGKADERKVVFTGFGKGVERLNVQQLLNSFNWGIDNRIHGATGGNGGGVEQVASGGPTIRLGTRDFSFDPRTLTMRPETGGGQHGLSFDDFGRKFVTQNSSHIRMIVYEDRYIPTNISFTLPPAIIDIAKEGPAAEVFRISPEEPWRTIRTKWRVAGQVPGPIEGGGRASGYFTGATGVTIYRGDAYPPEFRGNAFIGDAGGNLVHRKIFHENGVLLEASRAPDELNREFLASRDTWFRPVQFANGPDGCLYVIDMYREVIEHPWSLPPNLKKLIDLDSGRDRGRIWRIIPENFKRPPLPKHSKASTEEIVKALKSPNGWTRDTASRLLFERNEKSIAWILEKEIINNEKASDASRAQAFNLLPEINPEHILACLPSPEDSTKIGIGLREIAIRQIERLSGPQQNSILNALDVRSYFAPRLIHQFAWTLSMINIPDRVDRLARIATTSDDQWIQSAIVIAARNDASALFNRLIDGSKITASVDLLSKLVTQLSPADRESALQKATQIKNRADAFKIASAILEANEQRKKPAGAAPSDHPLFKEAIAAVEKSPGTELSQQALNLLRFSNSPESEALFKTAFHRANSGALHVNDLSEIEPAFRGLMRNPKTAAATLWDEWNNLSVPVRQKLMDTLMSRGETHALVLDAIRSGKITRADLTATQTQTLRQHSNAAISRPALELLGKVDFDRAAVIERFRPALTQHGDLKEGAKQFATRCATCHRLAGQGNSVGPDLESVRGNGREYLLIHLLDPNREVNSRYVAYTAELKDGDSITGVLASETDSAITLLLSNAEQKTISRAQLKKLTASAQSLMPNGLEEGLDPAGLASLLDYVQSAK
jgi:putative membrane-bound dehydrogenase-like protein